MNQLLRRRWQVTLALGTCIAASMFTGSLSTSKAFATDQNNIQASPSASQWMASPTLAFASPFVAPPQGEENATPAAPRTKRGINFLTLLTQGGWFMIPLLLLSLAVVTIAIERYLALRREKIFPPELIEQISMLSQSPGGLDPRRVYQACQRYPSSAAYVLRSTLVKVGRPQQEMENAVTEASQREATRLAQMTSWLSLAAAIAPLIGLLGTVWGITQAFYDTTQLAELNAGQNRGVALANGIYVALVTTMVGLMIAIPSAVLSHFYENRIIRLMNQIEEMIFNLLPQFERYEGQVRFTEGLNSEFGGATEEASDSSELETHGFGSSNNGGPAGSRSGSASQSTT